MAAIVIESDNNKNLKLLAALAEQLGKTVSKISPAQVEDLHLGMIMKKEKTRSTVSREKIFKHLNGK